MNNEWNDEVVVDVNESDITVDQAYDATSSNPQSGTAVAQAVAQAGGTVDQQYNASSANAQSGTAVAGAIAGVKQVPASTSADADKVLTVNSEGVPGWATAQGGGGGSTPVVQSINASLMPDSIRAELPAGEYLQPGLYQVFLEFGMSQYVENYRFIRFGFQVNHASYEQPSIYDPLNIDSNIPFSQDVRRFMRTGYIKVASASNVSGFYITFSSGSSNITNLANYLNHVSLSYMKVADLS